MACKLFINQSYFLKNILSKNMFKFIEKLFPKKPKIVADLYNIPTLQMKNLADFNNALEDIFKRRLDGIIIENALSLETVKNLIDFLKVKEKELIGEDFEKGKSGLFYPTPFSQELSDSQVRQKYFKQNEKDRAYVNKNLSIENTLIETLENLGGNRSVKIPQGENDTGSYLGFSLRKFPATFGGLPIHCGNGFQENYKDIYAHLNSICQVENQLSYFYTLQPSNDGGLTLYNADWKYTKTVDEIKGKIGAKQMPIRPNAGSLFIFAGGEIWHSVNMENSQNARITLGGFIGFGNDDKDIYIWS